MSLIEIELKGLSIGIDGCHIVKNIEMALPSGDNLIVMGPNGSGKSSLLKVLSGIQERSLEVEFSTFHFRGQEVSSLDYDQRAKFWTIVPQFPEWQRGLKVFQYLEFSRFPYFDEGRGGDPKLLEALSNGLGLRGLLDKNLEHLSGGERKRVAIAAALYQDVPVVFLDEPFQALDPLAKLELAHFLKQWQKERNISYVVASHDFYWAHFLCDQVLFLKRGEPLFYGNKDKVFTAQNLEAVYDVPFKWIKDSDGLEFFMPLNSKSCQSRTQGSGHE